MGEYVLVKDLPPVVRDALASVGYGRPDILVEAANSVQLSDSGSKGRKAFVCLVDLTNGKRETVTGSWGGPNMFDRDNAVDNDDRSYALPGDGVAIKGSSGGGGPTYATLHVPASMVAGMLPGPKLELSTDDLNGLYCYKAIKGGQYRRDELARLRVPADTLVSLVARGLLAENRAGARQITTDGKNALGQFRPSYF